MSSEYIGKRENEKETVMGKGLTNVFVMVIREKRKRKEREA